MEKEEKRKEKRTNGPRIGSSRCDERSRSPERLQYREIETSKTCTRPGRSRRKSGALTWTTIRRICTGFDDGPRDTGLLPLPLAAFALSSLPLLLRPWLRFLLLPTGNPNLLRLPSHAVHVGVRRLALDQGLFTRTCSCFSIRFYISRASLGLLVVFVCWMCLCCHWVEDFYAVLWKWKF